MAGTRVGPSGGGKISQHQARLSVLVFEAGVAQGHDQLSIIATEVTVLIFQENR